MGKAKILLIAGGTGGHVFPAISVGEYWKKQKYQVHYLTDIRGKKYFKEQECRQNICTMNLSSKPNSIILYPKFLYQLFISFIQSLRYILKIKPNIIICFSGFPTLPGIIATIISGNKFYIHEQNAVLGKVNRIFGKIAKKIFTSVPELINVPKLISNKITYVGMPVRNKITNLSNQKYTIPDDKFNILVIGGSQGARIFSTIIPKAIALLPKDMQIKISMIHQTRQEDFQICTKEYEKSSCNVKVVNFINDIDEILLQSQLIICRAGASTIAELVAIGRPAILIPYAHATDNHQLYNAKIFCNSGAGIMIAEEQFNMETLANKLNKLLNNSNLLINYAQNAKKMYNSQVNKNIMRAIS